jgi:hypothetical protein
MREGSEEAILKLCLAISDELAAQLSHPASLNLERVLQLYRQLFKSNARHFS